jgi:diguanylate cyclase (GGDEF)-like protein
MLIQNIAVGFYSLAVFAQLFATAYALNLFFRSKSYRLACGLLAIAFGLMIGRRISPLLHFYNDGYYNFLDAFMAIVISLLIFYGVTQLKKIIYDLEEKNFILDRSSKIDSLTQALSRSETFARSELEIERCFRNRDSLSFLMLDIDHFKNINDEYGHPIGDIVLTNLVKHCQEELRAIDIFGRVGGEEFFVVLPGVGMEPAFEVAERLRKKVASLPCAISGCKEIFISISIGVTSFSPLSNGETKADAVLRAFYAKADEAMYLAKAKGRNRTEPWCQ